MNSGTQPFVPTSWSTTDGATRPANSTAARQRPFTSPGLMRPSHSPARRASGTLRRPRSALATVSARSASRSDSDPWPRASDAMMAQSVSASDAPRFLTFTETAPSRSSNRPSRRAVCARIDAPPKAVRSRSVNSNSTFGGRIRRFPAAFRDRRLRFPKVHPQGEFPGTPFSHAKRHRADSSGESPKSLSGNQG